MKSNRQLESSTPSRKDEFEEIMAELQVSRQRTCNRAIGGRKKRPLRREVAENVGFNGESSIAQTKDCGLDITDLGACWTFERSS